MTNLLRLSDFYHPNFLQESIKKIKSNTGLSSSVVLSNKIYSADISIASKVRMSFLNMLKDVLLLIFFIKSGSLTSEWSYLLQLSHQVYKKKLLDGILFDESKPFCEDWYFASKVMSKGRCSIIYKHLTNHRYSTSSNTFVDPERIKIKSKTYRDFYNYMKNSHSSLFSRLVFNIYFGTQLIKNV